MKYYLALDNGQNKKEHLTKLNLQNLEKELDRTIIENNNLKKLTTFTMSFSNPDTLKTFLKIKNIISNSNIAKPLIITYKRDKTDFIIPIPYKPHEKYFNLNYLSHRIFLNINQNPKFLNQFLTTFPTYKYHLDEYFLLLEALEIPLSPPILHERITSFITALCRKSSKFSYRKLFDIAMFVSEIDQINERLVSPNYSLLNVDKTKLSDAQLFKLEEWLDNLEKRKLEKK